MKKKTLSRQEYNEKRKADMKDKERQIIDIAQKLFLKKGLDRVTMSDIMEASGTSRATMYRYFNSIHPIVFEVQYRMMNEIFRDLGAAAFRSQGVSKSGYIGMNLLVDHFLEHIDAYNYISMFDHFYAASYPDEKLTGDYASFLAHLFGKEEADSQMLYEIETMLTYANVIFSYLQKLAHRKKTGLQEIDFTHELQIVRDLIEKIFKD